jgi:hypothetical protein
MSFPSPESSLLYGGAQAGNIPHSNGESSSPIVSALAVPKDNGIKRINKAALFVNENSRVIAQPHKYKSPQWCPRSQIIATHRHTWIGHIERKACEVRERLLHREWHLTYSPD